MARHGSARQSSARLAMARFGTARHSAHLDLEAEGLLRLLLQRHHPPGGHKGQGRGRAPGTQHSNSAASGFGFSGQDPKDRTPPQGGLGHSPDTCPTAVGSRGVRSPRGAASPSLLSPAPGSPVKSPPFPAPVGCPGPNPLGHVPSPTPACPPISRARSPVPTCAPPGTGLGTPTWTPRPAAEGQRSAGDTIPGHVPPPPPAGTAETARPLKTPPNRGEHRAKPAPNQHPGAPTAPPGSLGITRLLSVLKATLTSAPRFDVTRAASHPKPRSGGEPGHRGALL